MREFVPPLARLARCLRDGSSYYGYDLSRDARVRSGVMYRYLDWLVSIGWVERTWAEPDAKGRSRAVYRATADGLAAFEAFRPGLVRLR